jgi:uncharacterized protein (DUF1330 family)
MPAFVLVEIEVTEPVQYEAYKKLAADTVAAFDGRYIVRGGKVETLEGEWPTSRLVILEFPTAARAREWWDSAAYRPARVMRQASARTNMILVDGYGL